MRIDQISTPAYLLDRRVLVANLDRMATRAAELGVALRPHVKTHKCIEVARLQKQRGARGLAVSTLREAAAFLAAGFDDLTWAFPLSPAKIAEALDLGRRGTLRLVLDDLAAFVELEKAAAVRGVPVHAWLKVDCGYHRAGVDPADPAAEDLARRMATSSTVIFDGLLTHGGHAYHAYERQQRMEVARQERDVVNGFAARLRAGGLEVSGVSLGSTPTLTIIDDLTGVSEARPGNYAFFDLTQVALGACAIEDIAVSVLGTVVSHPAGGDRAVIDVGALALSSDSGPEQGEWSGLMGAVCTDEARSVPDGSLRLESISQEHGVIRASRPDRLSGSLPVGSRVRILPNHSCLATACFDIIHVVDGGAVVDTWKIHRER